MTEAEPLRPGEVLDGKYEIERQLAAGAMGVIYVARHATLGRSFAVKALRPELVSDPEIGFRFQQEARAASAIGHPNIVDVVDLGCTNAGLLYMVMELLQGRALSQIIQAEGPLAVTRAVDIMSQVLSALAAAHRHDIVHRDLKPGNIFVVETEDRPQFVKLLDFGISKVLAKLYEADQVDGTQWSTTIGNVMGTPSYMSPEQARGENERVDHRSDIHAAGVVLYRMLTGERPYQGENYNKVIAAIIAGEFKRPKDLRPDLPDALERVILRAMLKTREARWQSADSMRDALIASVVEQTDQVSIAELHAEKSRGEGPVPEITPPPIADIQLEIDHDRVNRYVRPKAAPTRTLAGGAPPRAASGSRVPLFVGLAVALVIALAVAWRFLT